MVLLLELARGMAALWVFFFHAKLLFETSSPVLYQLSAYGSLGVPMFFVISGYVITFSAEANLKSKKSPFVFLKSRFLRIYPTFWASVAVILILPYIIELISSLKSGVYTSPESAITKYGYSEWSHFLLLSKVFFANSWDLQAEFNAINSVYWTLAIEFQFYLIIFLALFFGKNFKKVILTVSLISIYIIFIPGKAYHGLFIYYWPSFLVGIVLAYLHINDLWIGRFLESKVAKFAASLVVIVLLISSVTVQQLQIYFPVCFGIFLWANSYFEDVLSNINSGKTNIKYWLLKPLLILGTMSYSVYLLHGKLYQFPNMFVRQVIDPGNILFGLLTIVGTLLLCYPYYLLIESRFVSNSYKRIQKSTSKPAAI